MMWSEKYRPQDISDMVGNEDSRAALVEWFAKWKKGTKPILLVGPPGIGKTTKEISFAIDKKILLINAESESEIREIDRIAKLKKKKIQVGIRLNPNTEAKTLSQITTKKKKNKIN